MSEPAVRNDEPLVSVVMLAYRHERWAYRAVASVLRQRTDFPFEVLIGEDCSPDRTRAEIERAVALRPEVVRPFFHERNLGAHENLDRLLRAARGRYVAMLECDDEWIDDDKLAKQVALLEAHPEASAVFGRCRAEDGEGRSLPAAVYDRHRPRADPHAVATRCDIPTCTLLFRRQYFSEVPDWVRRMRGADWAMLCTFVLHGEVLGHPDRLALYRKHSGGAASMLPPEVNLLSAIDSWCELDRNLPALAGRETQRRRRSRLEELLRNLARKHRAGLVRCLPAYIRFCLRHRQLPDPKQLAALPRSLLAKRA